MSLLGIGIAGIAGSTIGAIGAEGAASTQAGAAENAQQLQAQEAQNALNFQEQEWGTQQANEAPFLKAGQGAVTQLSDLMQPGGSLSQPWTGTFSAPTAQQAEATPGYQFALQSGREALENSAAGAGALDTGSTGAALEQFGQGLASTDYQNTFNNALTQYQTAYNTFQQNQANQYNRLAGIAGTGQISAGQLGQQGGQAANNVSNTLLTSGAQQGQDINLAGAANASGYLGATNAFGNMFNGLGQDIMLQQLMQQGGGGGYVPGTVPEY